jgi:hypothetical protein
MKSTIPEVPNLIPNQAVKTVKSSLTPKPSPKPRTENLTKSNFNRNNSASSNQNTRPANVAFTRRNSPSQ